MSDAFDPLVDFYGRRLDLRRQALSAHLPTVHLDTVDISGNRQNDLHPSPHVLADIRTPAGEQVGTLMYGINPLSDRLYVFYIEIQPEARRQGYGLSVLWTLAQQHALPIVPNHIKGAALDFWRQAREVLRHVGVTITDDLRRSQMDEEKARWAHLVPEPEFERLIREYEASPEWAARRQELSS